MYWERHLVCSEHHSTFKTLLQTNYHYQSPLKTLLTDSLSFLIYIKTLITDELLQTACFKDSLQMDHGHHGHGAMTDTYVTAVCMTSINVCISTSLERSTLPKWQDVQHQNGP